MVSNSVMFLPTFLRLVFSKRKEFNPWGVKFFGRPLFQRGSVYKKTNRKTGIVYRKADRRSWLLCFFVKTAKYLQSANIPLQCWFQAIEFVNIDQNIVICTNIYPLNQNLGTIISISFLMSMNKGDIIMKTFPCERYHNSNSLWSKAQKYWVLSVHV